MANVYQKWCAAAIAHTHGALGATPSNALEDGSENGCVLQKRDVIKRCPNRASKLHRIRHSAQIARQKKCGNCGEYADVVFDYLYGNHAAFRFERASYIHPPGDHAFVIINRSKASTLSKPETWGELSYVIDAWVGATVAAKNYYKEMPRYPEKISPPVIFFEMPFPRSTVQ